SASAVDTFLPRISTATRFSFWAEMRAMRSTAFASLSPSARSRFALPMTLRPLGLLVRGVAVVGAGRRELAELVPHHVLAHRHRHMLVAVVHAEGQPHELGQDRRATAPDLDDLVAATGARLVGLLQEKAV